MTADYFKGLRLDGQTVVVTGAAAGIGRAIAELFSTQGATLALLDRSDTVEALATALGEKHVGIVCDVQHMSQIRSAVALVGKRLGRIDVLINNAGVALLDEATRVSEGDWDATMSVNLKAPFFFAQAVAPWMVRQGRGRIVNLASQAAVIALERHAAYCASKAALVSLTQVLALEWAGKGITVNAISPTVVETELGKKAWAGDVGVAMKKKIPTGRFAQPAEVASAALYLASEHAAMINGANLLIDGGYSIQ